MGDADQLLRPVTPRERIGPARDALRAWWGGQEDAARVMLVGLGLLAGGLVLVWPPLALIVPGAVLVAVALGFSLARPS